MHQPRPTRLAVALLCAHWLLASCSATAQAIWPEPRPEIGTVVPQARSVPNFQAPSATRLAQSPCAHIPGQRRQ